MRGSFSRRRSLRGAGIAQVALLALVAVIPRIAPLAAMLSGDARADDAPVQLVPAGEGAASPSPEAPRLDVPEPATRGRTTHVARGEATDYYDRLEPTGWAALRLLVGPVFRGSQRDVPGASLALDLVAGARLGFGRWREYAWAFVPEIGFSETSPFTRAPAHLFQMGVGFGHQNRGSSVGFVPRFVVGWAGGAPAMGGRGAIYGDMLTNNKSGFSVEVSYEALRLEPNGPATSVAIAHAVRLTLGVDLLLFFTESNCTAIFYGSSERGCSR